MSRRTVSRIAAAALIALAGVAMFATSFQADARRMGGGSSFGRQSTNVGSMRSAGGSPAGASTAARSAAPAAGATSGASTAGSTAAGGAAAAAGARSGASRWLGPIAGIAAGLGIGALLSHLGLSGAFASFLSSALLIALGLFVVMFIVRRLRGMPLPYASPGAAQASSGQGAAPQASRWNADAASAPVPFGQAPGAPEGAFRPAAPLMSSEAADPGASGAPSIGSAHSWGTGAAAAVEDVHASGQGATSWTIPGDFDVPRFLTEAKAQFVHIQAVWDSGDTHTLREFMTDDLAIELSPQILERAGASNKTEVVLLNAELLGIESVSGGNLASVRFSGMLRESPNTEAFRFEEVWNLFKPENGGWLLAGIQQIPAEYAS